MQFNSLILSLAFTTATLIATVRCDDESSAMTFNGLAANVEKPWQTGDRVTFAAKWETSPWFSSYDQQTLQKYQLSLMPAWYRVKDNVERVFSMNDYIVPEPTYSLPDAERWITVSFKVPPNLKTGKYYLKWDDVGMIYNDDQVESGYLYIVSKDDIAAQLGPNSTGSPSSVNYIPSNDSTVAPGASSTVSIPVAPASATSA